jgi:hypothetical protein
MCPYCPAQPRIELQLNAKIKLQRRMVLTVFMGSSLRKNARLTQGSGSNQAGNAGLTDV